MTTTTTAPVRGERKVRLGRVVSNRMQKTIVVQVDRLVRHSKFPRIVRRATRFKAHDERQEAKIGDWVKIAETRPLSKDKRWRLVNIIRRGSAAPAVPGSTASSSESEPVER